MMHFSHTLTKTMAAAAACFLLPTSIAAEADLGLAHQLFIVDHSGSMGGRYGWIGEAALALQANKKMSTKFSLAEFSKDTRPIELGGALHGNAEQFNRAVKQLKRGGGTEDGYLAIDKAITHYSIGDLIAPHVILITDEHRTSVKPGVDVSSVSTQLAAAQIPVTVMVNVRFLCDDKRVALGMNSHGLGIVLDANGSLDECPIGELMEYNAKAHSVTDYIDLALSTGGTAWDLNIPRRGPTESALFANAFARVHSASMAKDLKKHHPVPRVSYSPDKPKAGDVITFSASASQPADSGDYVSSWQWDFESDRQYDVGGATVAHAFATPGTHKITLSVGTANSGRAAQHTFQIDVLK